MLLCFSSLASAEEAGTAALVPEFLSVTLNGEAQGEPVLFLSRPDGKLYVSAESFAAWRLRLPPGDPVRFENGLYYPIASLPGLDVRVAEHEQAVAITVAAAGFDAQRQSLGANEEMPMTAPSTGAYLSYDLFGEYARGAANVSGSFEAVVFTPHGVGSTTFIAQAGAGADRVVRLESAWTIDRPDRMTTLRIGDSISSAGSGSVPFRFAGLQYARNFAVQPGYLTMALPTAQGSAAVASIVDLYVNNQLQGSRQVAPGPFELTNVPVQAGAGTVQVVVHDLLGRQIVSEQSYYAMPGALRRGVHDFSYEVGFLRRDFGSASNRYGALMASTSHRYGFTDRITGEAHAEATRDRQMAGVAIVADAFDLAQVGGSVSISHSRDGAGYSLAFSAERNASSLSFGLRAEHVSAHYAYVGEARKERPPRSTVQAFANVALPLGAIGINLVYRDNRDRPDEALARIFATARIGRGASLQLFAQRTAAGSRETLLGAHLAFFLGGRRSASADVEGGRHKVSGALTYQDDAPSGVGGGYRLAARYGPNWGGEAAYVRNLPMATVMAEVAHANGATGVRLSAAGSIGFMGGAGFASRSLGDSFANVRVEGQPGVRVYADDHLIGVTGRGGSLTVPGLRAYEVNHVRIDETDLPLDARIEAADVAVRPFGRSGSLIRFSVRRERGVLMRVRLENGRPLPTGAHLSAEGGATAYVAMPNGEVYAPDLAGTVRLRAAWSDGACGFSVTVPANDDPQPLLDNIICRASQDYAAR
jgi:outer membrane usher protein